VPAELDVPEELAVPAEPEVAPTLGCATDLDRDVLAAEFAFMPLADEMPERAPDWREFDCTVSLAGKVAD